MSFPDPPGRRRDAPFVTQCPPGKYAWCACGRSTRLPMCDGSHRGSGTTPVKVVLDEPRTVAWCACGRTASAPFCDGSHGRIGPR